MFAVKSCRMKKASGKALGRRRDVDHPGTTASTHLNCMLVIWVGNQHRPTNGGQPTLGHTGANEFVLYIMFLLKPDFQQCPAKTK